MINPPPFILRVADDPASIETVMTLDAGLVTGLSLGRRGSQRLLLWTDGDTHHELDSEYLARQHGGDLNAAVHDWISGMPGAQVRIARLLYLPGPHEQGLLADLDALIRPARTPQRPHEAFTDESGGGNVTPLVVLHGAGNSEFSTGLDDHLQPGLYFAGTRLNSRALSLPGHQVVTDALRAVLEQSTLEAYERLAALQTHLPAYLNALSRAPQEG